jgi:hypothetical protein
LTHERREVAGALESQQRPRLAGRHAELLARVGGQRQVVAAPLELGRGDDAQQGGHGGIQRLLEPDGAAQAPIELEGVRLGETRGEGRDGVGEALDGGG